MSRPILVLWNPGAGSAGAAGEARALLSADPRVEIVDTESGEDLLRQVEASGGRDVVAVAGGDGTVHAACAALAEMKEHCPRLAVIPVGTGNDTARSLGGSLDPRVAAENLLEGRTRVIWRDLILAHTDGGPVFGINSLSGGNATRVMEETKPEDKERWGSFAYFWTALSILTDLQVHEGWLGIDDEERVPVKLVNLHVANGQTASGGFPAAPRADPSDGRLDLVAVAPAPLPALLGAAARHLFGRSEDDPRLLSRQIRRATFAFEPPMDFRIDGEQVAAVHTVEVVPAALAVLAGLEGTD